MSLMNLKPCMRCHVRLCYRTTICLLCTMQAAGKVPQSLLEDVADAPEARSTCAVCQEAHTPESACPPMKLCWRDHSYYGLSCPVCEQIERGFQMLASDLLAAPPDDCTPATTQARSRVPAAFYAAFEGDVTW